MIEAVIEIVFGAVLETIAWGIVAFPGVLAIWLFNGQKQSIKAILNQKLHSALALGFVIWAVIIGLFLTLNLSPKAPPFYPTTSLPVPDKLSA